MPQRPGIQDQEEREGVGGSVDMWSCGHTWNMDGGEGRRDTGIDYPILIQKPICYWPWGRFGVEWGGRGGGKGRRCEIYRRLVKN